MNDSLPRLIAGLANLFNRVIEAKKSDIVLRTTSCGLEVRNMGRNTLQGLRLLKKLLIMDPEILDPLLFENRLPQILLRLFPLFPFHNIAHNLINSILRDIIIENYPKSLSNLLENGFVFSELAKVCESRRIERHEHRSYLLGYLGHFKEIADHLEKVQDEKSEIAEALENSKDFC